MRHERSNVRVEMALYKYVPVVFPPFSMVVGMHPSPSHSTYSTCEIPCTPYTYGHSFFPASMQHGKWCDNMYMALGFLSASSQAAAGLHGVSTRPDPLRGCN